MIGTSAFSNCRCLATLNLLTTQVNTIRDYAFFNCQSLAVLKLPRTLTYVFNYAFSGCDSLTDIYYEGTQQEYEAITGINDAGFKGTETIHYNYTPAE